MGSSCATSFPAVPPQKTSPRSMDRTDRIDTLAAKVPTPDAQSTDIFFDRYPSLPYMCFPAGESSLNCPIFFVSNKESQQLLQVNQDLDRTEHNSLNKCKDAGIFSSSGSLQADSILLHRRWRKGIGIGRAPREF